MRCVLGPALLLTLLLASVGAVVAAPPKAVRPDDAEPYSKKTLAQRGTLDAPQLVALISDPKLDEISGMAVSRRHPGLFWTHNDSGGSPQLFAFDQHGQRQAALTLRGVNNRDWEDMAAFRYQGSDYLLVADTGDNGGIRSELVMHVVAEPETLGESSAEVAWSIRFRWPDGPRDCEAVAVDAAEGSVYLVSKKRIPAELWRLPLAASDQVRVAEMVTTLSGISQPTATDLELNPIYGRYRSQITSADLSADGQRLAVLNYRRVYVFDRDASGHWPKPAVPPALELDLPWLAQAEAITFDANGESVWVSSERLPAPLLRLPLHPAATAVGQAR